MKPKLLVMLISIIIIGILFNINFISAFSGGNGTKENPYQITTWTELSSINNNLSSYFILMNDLKNTDVDYNITWIPLGDLTGELNGNNKVIYDLNINLPGTDYVGLFNYNHGNISNLNLQNSTIIGSNYAGAIVGINNGIINNSFSNGTVYTVQQRVGGLVGENNGIIINSHSEGSVSADSWMFGGLVGINNGLIKNSYSNANVYSGAWGDGGGLVAINYGNITECYATGSVTSGSGWYYMGGLVGRNIAVINNSYSTGYVNGRASGGLVGDNQGQVINSYSIGQVYAGSVGPLGGLIGLSGSSNNNSYWNTETSGLLTSAGGEGKTTEQMNLISTFVNWSISLTSVNLNNNFYPFLGFRSGLNNFVWYIWNGVIQKGTFQITSFSNGLTQEDLKFLEIDSNYPFLDHNETHYYVNQGTFTRYLNISKYSYITGASMNFSGFYYLYGGCMQETATITTTCGGGTTTTGLYGNELSDTKWYDGNYTTWSSASNGTKWAYINYTKPKDLEDIPNTDDAHIYAIWQIYTGGNNGNNTPIWIDRNQLNYYDDKIVLAIELNSSLEARAKIYIHNKTSWVIISSIGINNYQSGYEGYTRYAANNSLNEERIDWYIPTYPRNITLEIGTPNSPQNLLYGQVSYDNYEWFNIPKFYRTNVRTADLKYAINTYLSNCTTEEDNICLVPFLFSNNGYGHLRYSDIQINYDSIPIVKLVSPTNNSYSLPSTTFSCNLSDEINLKNVTLYIWNSTGIYNNTETRIITDKNNLTTFNIINFTTTGQYKWNCLSYNNNSYSNWQESNNTLNVDVEFITQDYPTNNKWLNYKDNININCTSVGINLDSIFLYGNFTGNWSLNQTKSGITTGVTNTFLLNLTDGTNYLWTCAENKTNNSTLIYSQYGNYTFNIDTIYPTMNNMSIITTANSNQVWFTTNITDLNLDSCKYSVWVGTTPGNQISFPCNNATLANAPGFGTYTLYVYGKDKAGNENSQGLSFTTSIVGGNTIVGGSSTTVSNAVDWTMRTSSNTGNYRLQMSASSTRNLELLFLNNGTTEKSIALECKSDSSLCEYIFFTDKTVILPVLKDITQSSLFTVNLPADIEYGTYTANIYGTDNQGNKNLITVEVVIGTFSFIANALVKLTSSKMIGTVKLPYFLILIFSGIVSFLPLKFITKKLGKDKRSIFNTYGTSLSVLVSAIIAFIVIVLI